MKKHSKLHLSLVTIYIAVSLAGCQTIQKLADAQKPSLSVKDVYVTDFAFDEIELTFDVQVKNPNPFELHLRSYDYDFNINGNTFVAGTRDKGLDIEASGANIVQVPISLNFIELYNLFNGLKGKDNADYKLLADLTFNLPVLGETTIPLTKSGSIPLLQLPKISVAGLQVKDLSLSDVNMELIVKMKNPNGFGLLLQGLNYRFKVNNEKWLNTRFTNNVKISKNDAGYIRIPISLNTLNIGASITEIINNGDDLNYSLKGTIDVNAKHPLLGDTDLPFFEHGRLPVMMQ